MPDIARDAPKWGKANEHFIQEHTQGPPINCLACGATVSYILTEGEERGILRDGKTFFPMDTNRKNAGMEAGFIIT